MPTARLSWQTHPPKLDTPSHDLEAIPIAFIFPIQDDNNPVEFIPGLALLPQKEMPTNLPWTLPASRVTF